MRLELFADHLQRSVYTGVRGFDRFYGGASHATEQGGPVRLGSGPRRGAAPGTPSTRSSTTSGSPIRAHAPGSSGPFSASEAPLSSAPARLAAPSLPPPSPDPHDAVCAARWPHESGPTAQSWGPTDVRVADTDGDPCG